MNNVLSSPNTIQESLQNSGQLFSSHLAARSNASVLSNAMAGNSRTK